MINSRFKKMLIMFILVGVITGGTLLVFMQMKDKAHEENNQLGKKIEQQLNEEREMSHVDDTELRDMPYFSLSEGTSYRLVSELDMFGEEIEVLKQQGNAYFVKGQYGTTLKYYRLYLIDQEGVNIFMEVTEDQNEYLEIETMVSKEAYNKIFELPSNQELFILKTPYEVGNEWGYGKIIELDGTKLVVNYENGNKITFEKPFGITEIEYFLPKEMQEHYKDDSFIAVRQEG